MLIEFNVTNYRSFLPTQRLQMTAGSFTDLREENSFAPSLQGLPRLLRTSVIYGPNAAGKSNLFKALFFMKRFVLTSAQGQEGDPVAVSPFLFESESPAQPSEFEVLFIADGVRYQYGFAADQKRVTHEWLLAYPQGKAQRWFERSWNPETQQDEWYFGSKFTGKKKIWQEATRTNALFLAAAVQLNNEQLKPVFYWFRNLVIIRHQDVLDPGFSMRQCLDENGRRLIMEFMNRADLSIDDIKYEQRDFSENELPPEMPQEMKHKILNDLQGGKTIRISFAHKIKDTDEVAWLPLEEESDGTRKLFAYAAPLLDGLAKGRVFLIDELDNSLHPHMLRFLLKLFHSPETNQNNGQLIFTTHNTSVLDKKIMRRDQVWFMEKDKQNASTLYPLSDFRPRKHEALEKGYLQGRYGALPYIGEVNF
ncbi:ATP-binding protein [bacterium]|nr:ATP-binding protein [bacterium]